MNQKRTIINLLFSLLGGILFGQQTANESLPERWTLEACVAYALEHNVQVKDFGFNVASDRETYRQSIRNLFPTANGSADYFVSYGRAEDPNTGTFVTLDFFSNSYNLNSSIDLFQGFQKWNTIRANKWLYQASLSEKEHQNYLLAFRVMQAFYDIRFFNGLTAIAEEQVSVSQQNYDLVQRQIDLGLMAGADLYEAESLLLTDKLNLTQAQNQLAAAKLNLIQEMNLEGVSTLEITTTLESELTGAETLPDSDVLVETALETVPLMAASEFRVEAARKQLAAARGNLYPSISLVAGFRTGYFETTVDSLGMTVPFGDQFRDNASEFVGFSMNIPISNAWSRRSQVKQQKIAYQRAMNTQKIQQQELRQTVMQLIQENESLKVQREQSEQTVVAQELAFATAQKRFEKGLINGIELFTAKNLYATAQNENLQVHLRYEINKSTLDFYQGLPVFGMTRESR